MKKRKVFPLLRLWVPRRPIICPNQLGDLGLSNPEKLYTIPSRNGLLCFRM